MGRLNSLTARVLIYTTLWAVVGVVIMAVIISAPYARSAERGLHDLLRAQLYAAINSVSADAKTKQLSGSPDFPELTFSQPGSGWYWEVLPLGDYQAAPLRSTSIEDISVPTPGNALVPFNARFERYYAETDSVGNDVRVAEAEVGLGEEQADDALTEGAVPAADTVYRNVRFRVIGNHDVVDDDVSAFNGSLYLALLVFSAGSLGLNALVILIGLKPLDGVRASLSRIRDGHSERLDDNLPREIQPLVNEVNALIENNRRLVERARMQVGNLAHSLKTPIAVLMNEADTLEPPHGDLVRGQVEIMQGQVQSYLNRARIAAQRESILARVELEPVLERLARVMRKLNPEREFVVDVQPKGLRLAMETQDLEETIGNLVENAGRFSRARVEIRAAPAPTGVTGDDPARRHWAVLTVDDDGPGLTPEEVIEAMKRGRRLDESKPGTGLGLSIVSEIVSEYKGSLRLGKSPAGGLRAELVLPSIVSGDRGTPA